MGQFALRDTVRPIREVGEGDGAQVLDKLIEHLLAGLPRLDAPEPHFLGRIELAQRVRHLFWECARRELSQLMAANATIILHCIEPSALRYLGGNCIFATELARRR